MTKKQKLNAAMLRQQSILDAAKNDGNRALTFEEKSQFDSIQAEIDELKRQIEEEDNAPDDSSIREAAIKLERQRISDINTLCRDFNIVPDKYIANGSTVDEVRAAVLEELKAKGAPAHIAVTKDEQDKFREAAADAIMLRSGLDVEAPAEGASELRALSLRDMAVECMERDGQSGSELRRMSGDDLFANLQRQFFNPSAAFPSIMDQTIKKSYEQGYKAVPSTFEEWTTKGTLTDFKVSQSSYTAGTAGKFLEVPENGELKADVPTDNKKPSRQLKTYGRQFTMSRQAFINDDIGFITTLPSRYAASAKMTLNEQVYTMLYDNGTIYDGKALFSADHKNLISTGAKPSISTVQKMMLQMQLQRDENGRAIIVTPRYIIVPVGYGMELEALLYSQTINTSENTQAVNVLARKGLKVIEDPALNVLAGTNACPWFMAADKSTAKSIQVDYLNGQEMPTIKRAEVPGKLGYVWDIFLDWAVTCVDFRGIVKNAGTTL